MSYRLKLNHLLAAALLVACLQPAWSQQNNTRAEPRAWGATSSLSELTGLREPVQLQDLPDFTGHAQFLRGNVHENGGGQTWSEVFNAKENVGQVLEWYQNVLRTNKWDVKTSNSSCVIANKSGNSCTVLVAPIRVKDYQSQIQIMYYQKKSTR